MILGTYANLGAIDEQQSGADINMSIDRLPDVHVPVATENIFITPSKMEGASNNIEIGPKKPIDIVPPNGPNAETISSKRKIVKTTKLPVQNGPIREINLIKEEANEIPTRSVPLPRDPVVPVTIKNAKNAEPNTNQDLNSAAALKSNVQSQLAEPNTDKKSTDSAINNEAIQKENLEMEIDAKESQQSDAKRTKEILDVVKSQLSKQNELNQKLVLDKINQISETVNNIAQMQNRSVAQKKDISQIENEVQKPKQADADGHVDQVKNSVDESMKHLPLPAVPVAKILVDRHSSVAPGQKPVIPEPAPKETKTDIVPKLENSVGNDSPKLPIADELPGKVKKMDANVGRDLLSNSNDAQLVAKTIDTAESSKVKTEN